MSTKTRGLSIGNSQLTEQNKQFAIAVGNELFVMGPCHAMTLVLGMQIVG